MYRFIVLLLLSSIPMPVLAERTVVTRAPYYNQHYAPQAYYGGDYIPKRRYQKQNKSIFYDINELEKYAMNKNYTKDNDRVRLERLETLAFGAVQEGDVYTRYDNVRNSILSRPKPNYKTSVLRNISNYFNGQITGYTPSVSNSYNNFYSNDYPQDIYPFEQKSYTEYHSPWRSGYKINDYSTGSSSSVHILD